MSDNITINIESPKSLDLDDMLKELNNFAINLKLEAGKLQQQIKNIEKALKSDKKKQKRDTKQVRRKPTGFALPCAVSNELCRFMNEEPNTKIARTVITTFLVKYIKDHKLENVNDRRLINPDEPLKKLLNIKDDTQVTYFNLQTYINHHFTIVEDK